MWPGNMFAHLMIPLTSDESLAPISIPAGVATTEAAWKIAAFSSAAPTKIGAHATIMDTDGATVLRAGTNGYTCLSANPRGAPEGGFAGAHEAMPVCLDSAGFQWIAGWMSGTAPAMDRDAFVWMLHGDTGYDNNNYQVQNKADADPATWVESGPHLMLMPKNPASIEAFPTDFHNKDANPFVMFQGSLFAHLMIPMPGFYAYWPAVAPSLAAEPTAKTAAAHEANTLVVGTLAVALVAALAIAKSRFEANTEEPAAPVLV
jgi:hypothetical protein